MSAGERLLPASEDEAAAMIRDAAAAGQTLALEGGGTRASVGRPVMAHRTMSTSGLSGIAAYNPRELVISVRAGTPLSEVEAALAGNGQRLAFEPVDHRRLLASKGEPTIGGVAAINNSGPRRILAGAARDSLIGVRFINGRGEIIRNGGRVMKNVTGLDLVKLMAGSWGTLGLITEVTFKVLPAAETEATLALRGLDDADAARAMAHAMASSCEVSGAAHLPETAARALLGGDSATVFRIEGFAGSVADRIGRLSALFDGVAPAERIGEEASRRLWRAIADVEPFSGSRRGPVWRVSMLPSRAHEFVMALRMKMAADVYYDWQGGLVWLCLEDDVHDAEIRAGLARYGGGNAMLMRADGQARLRVPVFQPQAPAIAALSERIRAALDPQGIFNPGRMTAN